VGRLDRALRNRLLPAILTATGVSLIAGGLLTYTGAAEITAQPSPTTVAAVPTPTIALPTFTTSSASPPTASPTPFVDRVATRVRIPSLDIDLPVIKPSDVPNEYPKCDVAMYIKELHQPGQGGATYLYAHARPGMFGPIYNLAIVRKKPNSMIGMFVEVFTSDNMRFTYQVNDVRLDQRDLNDASNAPGEELWLQTSEGPKGTPGKTQLRAMLLTVGTATHAEAHPVAKPVDCG
jgi:sortase (surface protein transpeptidase)